MTLDRVLFLDCDGVINSAGSWERAEQAFATLDRPHDARDGWRLIYCCDQSKVDAIAALCARTGARLVVCSVWRADMWRLHELFDPALFHPTDPRTDATRGGEKRGDQVTAWLARHPEVRVWAVVDDDTDYYPAQRAHLVQPETAVGLLPHHVTQLEYLLKDACE